jgi:hypothetical protein
MTESLVTAALNGPIAPTHDFFSYGATAPILALGLPP